MPNGGRPLLPPVRRAVGARRRGAEPMAECHQGRLHRLLARGRRLEALDGGIQRFLQDACLPPHLGRVVGGDPQTPPSEPNAQIQPNTTEAVWGRAFGGKLTPRLTTPHVTGSSPFFDLTPRAAQAAWGP